MKWFFKKYKNLHYLYSMINDVIKIILRVYHGIVIFERKKEIINERYQRCFTIFR